MYKSINDIRKEFLDFFQKKEHHLISSSSLVPEHDSTLLFTNAGMNQFKNIFLGIEKPLFKRVVTVQRCMRAGGKHNDLDNVGYTDRHLTFFEMLGNFSFGDYFKSDAIQFAWELLTSRNWFNLPKDRILVTTHVCDDESYNIWKNHIGISKKHLIKVGNKKDNFCNSGNFWQMGNVGPCGPCSEIFYDRGDDCDNFSNRANCALGKRYLEIWNLVFVQFNRQINGDLSSLSMLSVDTGMGLERITAILQGVDNNYYIDVFNNLIIAISEILKIRESIKNRSLYVIADHIRACSFLIKDGITPSNEGRGYVLRRIIRRAIYHGKRIGAQNIFLYKLVDPLIMYMRCLTDILYDQKDLIEQILFNEEILFANTLQKGLELLNKKLMHLEKSNILSGKVAFCLYSTYGFPLELTKDICYARNITVDQLEFDHLMLEEKKHSKASSRFFTVYENIFPSGITSKFIGYHCLSCRSKVIILLQDKKLVSKICSTNQESMVILDITPFYGESGGQIGDVGFLKTTNAVFEVTDTKKYGDIIAHIGKISVGMINVGDEVFAEINTLKRKKISLNHTATHLLHTALINLIGLHIVQKGSLVTDKYLRFDFSHYGLITEEQISKIETMVNQQVWNNLSIIEDNVSIESAYKINALMLPNKKYNECVRVLRIGTFSTELCGGTHALCTGEIGCFIITKEFGIGSGIRRIEAVIKDEALFFIQQNKILLNSIIKKMHSDNASVLNKINEFKLYCAALEKEIKDLKNMQEVQKSLSLVKDIFCIKDISVLINVIHDLKLKSVFKIVNHLKCYVKSGIIVLIHNDVNNKKFHIIIKISKDLIECDRIDALKIMGCIIQNFGGKGGGTPDFSQISIYNTVKESEIIVKIRELLDAIL